jgi:hypothetical protein
MLRLFKAIRPKQGFHVDEPPTSSKHTAELFATVRNNGRILDEFKCVLGGSEVVESDFSLGLIFENPVVAEFTARIQRWPRDIDLRKGLLSSTWQDFKKMVTNRDVCILDKEGGGLSANDFLKACSEMEEAENAAIRWAIVLNDGGRLAIQLQGLPASASVLNGKPSLKRYSPFIIIWLHKRVRAGLAQIFKVVFA